MAHQYLSMLLSHYSPPHLLRSQNSDHLIISKLTVGGRSFFYLAPKLWKNLPNNVLEADTVCQFRSSVRNPSPGQPSGRDHWKQLSPYNLTLLQLEQTAGLSGLVENWSPTKPSLSQGFFSFLSPMEFWFLAAVTSGLLSGGHFISSDIVNLITQILFKLDWAGRCHHWIK